MRCGMGRSCRPGQAAERQGLRRSRWELARVAQATCDVPGVHHQVRGIDQEPFQARGEEVRVIERDVSQRQFGLELGDPYAQLVDGSGCRTAGQ